jgi:hypothetical protein
VSDGVAMDVLAMSVRRFVWRSLEGNELMTIDGGEQLELI